MNPELNRLLSIIAIGLTMGLLVRMYERKRKLGWVKSFRFSLDKNKRRVLLSGLLLFIVMGATSFMGNRPYFGCLFTALALLEAYGLAKYELSKGK